MYSTIAFEKDWKEDIESIDTLVSVWNASVTSLCTYNEIEIS